MAVRSSADAISHTIRGFSNAAVTAGLILEEFVCLAYGRIEGLYANASTAGVGAGSTTLDVLLNGTSIFTVTANRPTIAQASTGNMTSGKSQTNAVKPGDVVQIKVLSIPATTGHARVSCTVAVMPA